MWFKAFIKKPVENKKISKRSQHHQLKSKGLYQKHQLKSRDLDPKKKKKKFRSYVLEFGWWFYRIVGSDKTKLDKRFSQTLDMISSLNL